MRNYPVKENPIGSAVSEILCYKQTDKLTDKQTDRHRSTLYYRYNKIATSPLASGGFVPRGNFKKNRYVPKKE